MEKSTVCIIGGGPVGSFIANQCAKNNIEVSLFEEHKVPGLPLQCAGLVTQRVLDFLPDTEHIIQNKIYGARIHSPSGKILQIGGDHIHAYAINRKQFDQKIIHDAKHNGAHCFFNFKVEKIERKNKKIKLTIKNNKKTVEHSCELLIGADGPRSLVQKTFSFQKPEAILLGMGAELSDVTVDPKFVEIFVGNTIAPGFFAWVIPTNPMGTTARVGLCVDKKVTRPVKHYFQNLQSIPEISSILNDAHIMQYTAGTIPLGPLKQTTNSQVMLVGDAAAQIKPTSGGGLYPGLTCAKHCFATIADAIDKQNFSQSYLKQYHKAWMGDVGKELVKGMRFRSMFLRLNDRQFDKYIEKLNTTKITTIINEYGDIDFPSKLVMPLLKKSPSLIKALLS